jgi:hypothetical protein
MYSYSLVAISNLDPPRSMTADIVLLIVFVIPYWPTLTPHPKTIIIVSVTPRNAAEG